MTGLVVIALGLGALLIAAGSRKKAAARPGPGPGPGPAPGGAPPAICMPSGVDNFECFDRPLSPDDAARVYLLASLTEDDASYAEAIEALREDGYPNAAEALEELAAEPAA